jgi:murein DD-endopeptidase MepM/ murein hydrolase activator NlpD
MNGSCRTPARSAVAAALVGVLLLSGCNRLGAPAPVSTYGDSAPPAPGMVTVGRGDTVFDIARRYNVPMRDIIEMNGLKAPYNLLVGQRLQLPGAKVHTVQKGDTLYGVSRMFRVDMTELARTNGMQEPYQIRVGQQLRIPGAGGGEPAVQMVAAPQPSGPVPNRKPDPARPAAMEQVELAPMSATSQAPTPAANPAPVPTSPPSEPRVAAASAPTAVPIPPQRPRSIPAAAPAPTPPSAPESETASAPAPAPTPTPIPATPTPVVATPPAAPAASQANPPPRTSDRFLWPVRGTVLSDFGPKPGGLHNDGINIEAARGSTVIAADSGIVAYAGNELRGFGNLLLIRHANGWMTAYAHLGEMLVDRGSPVKRGQKIGTVGSSGSVSSPQLHFEVRRGSRAVDPRDHLESDRRVSRDVFPGVRPGLG